jgi:hypothetical protein
MQSIEFLCAHFCRPYFKKEVSKIVSTVPLRVWERLKLRWTAQCPTFKRTWRKKAMPNRNWCVLVGLLRSLFRVSKILGLNLTTLKTTKIDSVLKELYGRVLKFHRCSMSFGTDSNGSQRVMARYGEVGFTSLLSSMIPSLNPSKLNLNSTLNFGFLIPENGFMLDTKMTFHVFLFPFLKIL